jgi:tetratricopeptide (TPR) repeat protein
MHMTRPITAVTLTASLLVTSAAFAQHEDHHAGAAPDQIGSASVRFDNSCAPAVRDDVNKAVAFYHSFWFPEAIRMFESVGQRDPACALAWWGIAMSQWGNPYAGLKSAEIVQRGKATVEKGRTVGSPSSRERALLEAVGILYSSPDPATHRDRVVRYEDAMRRVAADNPKDVELRILYALAVTQSALPTDKTYAKLLQAADILEPLFKQMPTHPGLAHYIIHAYDAPPLASRALTAARRYASLAPAAPHALHMPSHTFTRLGFWTESIDTNRRSAETARKVKDVNAELHALDYQTYAYLQMGRDSAAKVALERAAELQSLPGVNTFAAAAIPARYAMERGDWAAAAALSVQPAANTPYTEAMTHFARAIGFARSGQPQAASPEIAKLGELRDKLASMRDPYWAEQVDIQRRVALAWQTYASGQRDQAIAQLRAAADAEDATDKAAVTPGPLAPARELLGYMLLEAGRARDALTAFEATMKKEPNRFRGTYGAARAAEAAGNRGKARRYYGQLLEIARDADPSRSELIAARKFVDNR